MMNDLAARIKILIAEDHPVYIDGLLSVFEDTENFKVVGFARNGFEVLDYLSKKEADVVLVDINMPKMDGIECIKQIHKKGYQVKIIVLSQFGEKRLVQHVKQYISGYLLKDAGMNEIITAIELVMLGQTYYSKSLGLKANKIGWLPELDRYYDYPEVTKYEKEVLQLVCNEYESKEIAGLLGLSLNTVDTLKTQLLVKTRSNNMIGLVKWAIKRGIVS
ncbi:MAG: response regulator transcription factor [Bacteroidales bacterium]|nr:response regulator transcription factor [Bacteroidales bacterium]